MATGSDPPPRSPSSSKKKKNGNGKGSLVVSSLAQTLDSTLSFALSEAPPAVHTKNLRLPELLAPRSGRRHYSYSDDDTPSPTSPTRRWTPHSPLFHRKKKNRTRALNNKIKSASSSPVLDDESVSSTSSTEGKAVQDAPILRLEATQVDSLPGQPAAPSSSFPCNVPTILVSPDQEEYGGLVRKTSQCSHLSAASSTITSGAALSKHVATAISLPWRQPVLSMWERGLSRLISHVANWS